MAVKIQKVKIGEVKSNLNNPRLIKDDKFHKLVESIKSFPQMLELRPIVVNDDMVVLGGNMRLKACKEAGLKDVPIMKASDLTEEQQKEFIIKDNVGFGEWDWDMIANEWDAEQVVEWGLDIPIFPESGDSEGVGDNNYSRKIEAPKYEVKGEKPEIVELYSAEKYTELCQKIEGSGVPEDIKKFLLVAASRHIVFNYGNIAEYYAHAPKEVQELMEESALVIIDFDKAIELGFVKLSEQVSSQYQEDHEEQE